MRVVFLALVVLSFSLRAQESAVTATNPASLKWYQLNTPNFRLLYPQGFDVQAQRMANTLEGIREPEARTVGTLPKRISILLQNQSSLSNAFVSITPRRAEFYTMPSQNYNFTGNNDWLNLLATHEYRHMAQFQHATRGFNKLFQVVFGNNVLAGMAYVAAPQWFWEGDAVATETAFTQSGRGRIPNFDLVLRTNLQENRVFNYHKQYLRSYKNNINDHYVLGFHMVSYLRKKTGDPFIWDKVTARSWNVSFIPFRFSSSLKKETGLYVKDLYNEMAADLQKEWKVQQDTLKLTAFERVNARTTNAYTDYLYPQELEDGRIAVRKAGIGDIEKLVVLRAGSEQNIHTQGIINESGMQSAANSRVVWNEFRFDPRWQVRTYSTIIGYDVGSGKRHVVAARARYAGAALSPDGYRVATVETSTAYQTRMVVLDYFSGRILKSFENADNDFISMPRWTPNGKEIIALATNTKGKAIVKFDFDTGTRSNLTDFSTENVGYPVPFENYILYNSPVSGIDNIYALHIKTGARYQVTCSRYGSYNPAVSRDGKWIYYNEQGRDGMDVGKISFDPAAWKIWTGRKQPQGTFDYLVKQEGSPQVLGNLPARVYDTKRYHRWKGLINPYSWGATLSTTLTSAFVGITSQDLLSTTLLNAGYSFDKTENTGTWLATASYQGWYPIIDFSVSQGDRKVNEGDILIDSLKGSSPNYSIKSHIRNLTYQWTEKNMETGLRLPLNTTTSRFVGNITFGNAVGVTHVTNFTNTINNDRIVPTLFVNDTIKTDDNHPVYFLSDHIGNGNLVYNRFFLTAYRLLKQSRRDINSKWGQALFLTAYNTPYGGDYSGRQFSIYGVGYFPGLFKHHSLWGYWGYQNSQIDQLYYANKAGTEIADNGNYQFRNQIPLPRGGLGVSRFQNFYSMSANYTMPVWYPDAALGPLLNIQRIRMNGFFDYGYGSTVFSNAFTQTYMSTGVEVKFDVNVMRLLPQLDIGFRYSKGIQPSTSLFEVLVGTINF